MNMIQELSYKDRDEWLALRKKYIGGSDAASVVGLNPYSSQYALWCEKTGRTPGFEGNLATMVGTYLEDFVAKLFMSETGKKVRRKNRMLVNSDYPFAAANVDRVIMGENAILEIKTTNSLPNMNKFKSGEYPEMWYCQMMHYMAVGGYEKAYLAVLVGGREFRTWELKRDEEEIKSLMAAEELFWHFVETDIPPEADGSDATSAALMEAFSPEEVDIDLMDMESHFARLEQIAELMDDLKSQKEEEENKIKAIMQSATNGHCNGYKCSWKPQTKTTFDAKAFAEAHPEMDLTSYYKTSISRPFRFSKIKKEK